MATIAEAALHLDMGERRFRELLDSNVIARAERGTYDLDVVRVAFIRHLREQAAGRAPTGDLDPGQERARKDRALAVAAEIKNEMTIGNVVLIDDVMKPIEEQYGIIRQRVLAMPSRAAMRMPEAMRAVARVAMDNEVHEALTELSEETAVEEAKAASERRKAR